MTPNSASDNLRARAKGLIALRACAGLTIKELAAALGVSRSTLEREFESEPGGTPAQMIKLARLARAGELLAETDLLIKQIAMQVGFEHSSNFYRAFHSHFGQSPSAFRHAARAKTRIGASLGSVAGSSGSGPLTAQHGPVVQAIWLAGGRMDRHPPEVMWPKPLLELY